jgi:hypothetical protein
MQIGTIDEPLPEMHERFMDSSLLHVLVKNGPKALIDKAISAGYKVREDGYIDQCHLCYDLFKDETVAAAVKQYADDLMEERTFQELSKQFLQNFSTPNIASPIVETH